jgi:hypothetical protein
MSEPIESSRFRERPSPAGSPRWHVPGHLAERYAAGTLDAVQVMSVEAHLAGCERCRAAVPADEPWLAASWDRILDEVDRPRTRAAERVLRLAGVPEHLARFLVATPGLTRAWLVSVAFVLAFAVAVANLMPAHMEALLAFLAIAPVLPLAGIAAAYGPHVDPVYELQAATPMAGSRTLLLRSVAVLVPAVVMTGLATPFLPGPPGLSTAWVLPSLVLTLVALALSSHVPVRVAASLLASCWLGTVLLSGGVTGDRFGPFHPPAQLLYGCATLIVTSLLYARHRHPDQGEPR